jgi:hypothetical protein
VEVAAVKDAEDIKFGFHYSNCNITIKLI